MKKNFLILGAGNIGMSLAYGLEKNKISKGKISIVRRSNSFSDEENRMFSCGTDSSIPVAKADIIFLAVQPKQLESLIDLIRPHLRKNQKNKPQVIISLITGKSIQTIKDLFGDIGKDLAILRSMPNTALKDCNSMTCLNFSSAAEKFKDEVIGIFNLLGETLVIREEMFAQATVLCGSGIAVFARFARAYMQSGIQAGFNEHDSLKIVAQLMRGIAGLLKDTHPELVVDKVTTPGGCTIDTLAEMEHWGFTSALLKAVSVGTKKAQAL